MVILGLTVEKLEELIANVGDKEMQIPASAFVYAYNIGFKSGKAQLAECFLNQLVQYGEDIGAISRMYDLCNEAINNAQK